jgi:hypothetical protein
MPTEVDTNIDIVFRIDFLPPHHKKHRAGD